MSILVIVIIDEFVDYIYLEKITVLTDERLLPEKKYFAEISEILEIAS